jgi:hypothetical protein
MSQAFPEILSAPLGEVPSGSIAILPHSNGNLWALVTNEASQESRRSIMILRGSEEGPVNAVIHENWLASSLCAFYKTPLRFEIGTDANDIDLRGNWWDKAGVIILLKEKLLMCARSISRGGIRYVDIQTGEIYSDQLPPIYGMCGKWSLWQRDPLRSFDFKIADFKAAPS